MGRDYKPVKNGKFVEDVESFSVNVAGASLLGCIFYLLDLPTDRMVIPGQTPQVAHNMTGQNYLKVLKFLESPKVRSDLLTACELAIENDPGACNDDETPISLSCWVLEFMRCGKGYDGFASDYCAEFY